MLRKDLVACEVCTDNAQAGSVAAENMYNAIKDVIANAEGQVIIGEVNQDATAQNIQQRGGRIHQQNDRTCLKLMAKQ